MENNKCEWCGEGGCEGESYHFETCVDCRGMGGADWTKDCEVYDDWHKCPVCDGYGKIANE